MRGALSNGKRIRESRLLQGLTQEELSVRAACDVKTVRNAESGKSLDVSTLQKIADALSETLSSIALETESLTQNGESKNVQQVRRWQNAFNDQDIDRMLDVYHENAVLMWSAGLPDGQSCRGKLEIRRQAEIVFQHFDVEMMPAEKYRVHAINGFVILRAKPSITVRTTGKKITSELVLEFHFDGDRIKRHTALFDTLSIAKGFS